MYHPSSLTQGGEQTRFAADDCIAERSRAITAVFNLHRLNADGRLVLVRAIDTYPLNPDGYRLPASDILNSVRAESWIEAKFELGFPLTSCQMTVEEERLDRAINERSISDQPASRTGQNPGVDCEHTPHGSATISEQEAV